MEIPQSDHKDVGSPQIQKHELKPIIQSKQEQQNETKPQQHQNTELKNQQQHLFVDPFLTQSEDEKHTDQSDQEQKKQSNSENENRKPNKSGQTATNEGSSSSSLPTSPTKSSISQSFFPTKWIEWHVVAMRVVHFVEC